jgi:soluble lytic murein transglycosylase
MPRVPTYDNFTVAPSVNPDVRVVAPEIQDFSSKQAAAASQAMVAAGSAVSRIGADMQNDANLVRVDDATNKANEAALALQYDKANGFLNIKGEAALNRESGMPLADEYRDKFKQRVDEISQSLGNDAQRKMFALKANDMATRLYGTATAHETQQFNDYTVSVQDGKLKNASNAIVLDPLNKDNVLGRLEEINQAVYVVGKTKGMSAEAIAATQREAVSGTT